MKIVLAHLHGFCAGVVRAIDIVERALTKYPESMCATRLSQSLCRRIAQGERGAFHLRIWTRSLTER